MVQRIIFIRINELIETVQEIERISWIFRL